MLIKLNETHFLEGDGQIIYDLYKLLKCNTGKCIELHLTYNYKILAD